MIANDYEKKARRSLTFAERKVNLSSIKENMRRLSLKLDAKLAKVKNDILTWKAGDSEKLVNEIVSIVTEIQKEAFDFWKQTASNEMKVKAKPTNKNLEWIMKKQNTDTIKKMLSDIKKKFDLKWYKRFSEWVFAEFSETGILSQFFNWLKSLFVMWSINLGRETVREDNPEMVYAFQFSAILDDRTTDICNWLDGVIVKPWSDRYYQISPPRHWGCRSIWVEILTDEPYKPRFTKDSNVPSNTGIAPNIWALEEWKAKQQVLLDADSA